MTKFALSAVLSFLFVSQAWAAFVTDPGTLHTTSGLTTSTTFGDTMDGMSVTAVFSSGQSVATWGDTGSGAGGAFGAFNSQNTNWSLVQSGNTFSPLGTWTLRNNTGFTMIQLIIKGAPGKTVFDIFPQDFDPDGTPEGTLNSDKGRPFARQSGHDEDDILVTYRNAVQIGTADPVGDVWETLDLKFNVNGSAGIASVSTTAPASLVFLADTDNAAQGAVIEPSAGPVPEPASLAMWAIGALGCTVAGYRRRKRA
jgi:hypothetical protein